MRVIITGATGFIGFQLAIKSQEQGHEVVALGRINNDIEHERAKRLKRAGVTVSVVDLSDRFQLIQSVKGCDVIFHLAAAQHEANVSKSHYYAVNVEGTRNMLDAAIATGTRRFVYGSTIGVYGSAADGELSETSPLMPDNIYGSTKLEAERLVLSRSENLPVSIARISETYGPGDWRLLKLFKAIEKKVFFVIGAGRNKHQLIYVDDLLDGLYTVATKMQAVGQIYVLAGAEVLTTREIVCAISSSLGVRQRRTHLPMWPFMVAAWVFEKTMTPIGVQPPLHRRRLDFFRKSFHFSTEKAERELRFKAKTNFAAGAAATALWYKEAGLL